MKMFVRAIIICSTYSFYILFLGLGGILNVFESEIYKLTY